MKILRIVLAAVLLVAALLALSAQRQGGGALAAQSAYLVALVLLIIDRVMMVRKERLANGRAVMQIGLGMLIASLLFSPDFASVVQKKTPGLSLENVLILSTDNDPKTRALALEICLQRRAYATCSDAFVKAAKSDDPLIRALGQAGLRGRSGLRR
jgi:hypothetical protein